MGVPLSNFTVLKYIADSVEIGKKPHGRQSIEMELALDSLKEYSVFAFIIHDPIEHHEFHSYLENKFQRIHYSSGDHLVFFGLVDSPKKLSLVSNRPFYQDIRDMVTSYEDEESNNLQESYSAFAIANSLNIEPEMLPAIVITHDTRLTNYRYYKTCPKELEQQFYRLTGISNQMNIVKNNFNFPLEEKQAILYELLDKENLDLCEGNGNLKLTDSMARALSDVLSFLVPDSHDYNERTVKKIATEEKNNSIKRLTNNLEQLRRDIDQVNEGEFESHQLFSLIEELNIKLAIFLKMHNEKDFSFITEPLPIKKEWLDQHTWQLLITGIEVSHFLQRSNSNFDYSASAICLAKMFEQEINNSFVHWVRKENAIQLPKYYNKVQPRVSAQITPNFPRSHSPITPINLNKSKNGFWQAPELGKSLNIAKYNISENDWARMGINNSKYFMEQWTAIHSIRNKAAHTDEVTFNDFKKMKSSLETLANNHIFEQLSLLKSTYKGAAI